MSYYISHVELLRKLISFRSITPDDGGSLDFIVKLLSNFGFKCYIKKISDVTNLYATIDLDDVIVPSDFEQSLKISAPITTLDKQVLLSEYQSKGKKDINICFVGHVDVVPPQNEWKTDPFSGLIIDSKIYGRGAVDMKSSIACMISALFNFFILKKESNTELQGVKSFSFLLTSDEEGEAIHGTKEMLKWIYSNGHKIDFAIVGEPTSEVCIGDTIKIGRRGSVFYEIVIYGIGGHVAYPQYAQNPNTIITRILNDLTYIKLDDGDSLFDPSNLEIISIDCINNTTNVIPETARALINIRFNTQNNATELKLRITNIIQKYTDRFDINQRISAISFISKDSIYIKMFRDIISNTLNINPSFKTSGGTSDARFVQEYCSVLEFGPTNSTAHKKDEYISLEDINQLYNIYFNFIANLMQ